MSRVAKGDGNTCCFREQESLLGEDPNIDKWKYSSIG